MTLQCGLMHVSNGKLINKLINTWQFAIFVLWFVLNDFKNQGSLTHGAKPVADWCVCDSESGNTMFLM